MANQDLVWKDLHFVFPDSLTLWVGAISDSELESLARYWDLEGDQGCILAGEQNFMATAGAERKGSLVQSELMVFRSREHFTIQLPAIKKLTILLWMENLISWNKYYHDKA